MPPGRHFTLSSLLTHLCQAQSHSPFKGAAPGILRQLSQHREVSPRQLSCQYWLPFAAYLKGLHQASQVGGEESPGRQLPSTFLLAMAMANLIKEKVGRGFPRKALPSTCLLALGSLGQEKVGRASPGKGLLQPGESGGGISC